MENRKPVALQAHLDMVPQKNNDTVHDFVKDPIQPYIDGEWVKARHHAGRGQRYRNGVRTGGTGR